MNKINAFLTAAALTAAALATIPAAAYGAYIGQSGDAYGFAVNAESVDVALQEAVKDCNRRAGDDNACILNDPNGGFQSSFVNTCIGIGYQAGDPINGNPLFRVAEITRELANQAARDGVFGCPADEATGCLRDLSELEVCDHTCEAHETAVEDPFNNADCRACPTATTHELVMISGTDTCLPQCMGNKIRSTTGDLTECVCPEGNNDFVTTDSCVPNEVCGENQNLIKEGSECECDATAGYVANGVLAEGGSCEMVDCGDNSERIADTATCRCIENHSSPGGDGKNCVMNVAPPEFTFSIGGENITTTPQNRHEVAFDNAATIEINIATTADGDFTYAKTGDSSDELTVGMNDGVIGFTSTVMAADYEILVAAAQNQTIIATISLYLTVAEMMTVGGGGDETPVFTFSIGEDALEATVEDNQFIISMTAATDTAIEIATTLAGVSYAIITNNSSDVLVLNNGIVSFANPDSVAAGSYQFFVAATRNGTIIATIALYLTIAGEETGGGGNGNNLPIIANPDVLSPEGRSTDSVVIIGISSGLLVFMSYYLLSEYVGQINWSPSYAFEHNNGNMSYSVGSRWTAAADNWRFYWQTNQNGGDNGGEFRYGSGMQYHNGIFLAALNSQSDKDTTDVGVSFSANQTAGLWQLNGGYNFGMQISNTEPTNSRNRLNLSARYVVDKWILSTNANSNGKTATAKINYSYRF